MKKKTKQRCDFVFSLCDLEDFRCELEKGHKGIHICRDDVPKSFEVVRKIPMKFEEKEPYNDNCSGWRYPEECPHDGVYQEGDKDCQDCCDDAMRAMEEANAELLRQVDEAKREKKETS